MDEINEILYCIADQAGVMFETENKGEARQALIDRRAVVKKTLKIFNSGPSTVRIVVTTDIEKPETSDHKNTHGYHRIRKEHFLPIETFSEASGRRNETAYYGARRSN